jgi:hypothetical protein
LSPLTTRRDYGGSILTRLHTGSLPLGPLTRFYLALLSSSDNYFILLSKASSLTRKRVCSLQCNHSLVRLLKPSNHTLPSHPRLCSLSVASYDSQRLRWRYSNPPPHGNHNLKGQVSVFIFSRKRVTQLCPKALGSHFFASYCSRGYGRLHTGSHK